MLGLKPRIYHPTALRPGLAFIRQVKKGHGDFKGVMFDLVARANDAGLDLLDAGRLQWFIHRGVLGSVEVISCQPLGPTGLSRGYFVLVKNPRMSPELERAA